MGLSRKAVDDLTSRGGLASFLETATIGSVGSAASLLIRSTPSLPCKRDSAKSNYQKVRRLLSGELHRLMTVSSFNHVETYQLQNCLHQSALLLVRVGDYDKRQYSFARRSHMVGHPLVLGHGRLCETGFILVIVRQLRLVVR